MSPARVAAALVAGATFSAVAVAQSESQAMAQPQAAVQPQALAQPGAQFQAQARFKLDEIEKGREQFHHTCSHCHGFNMVNSGTTVYDLRRFPIDDPDRFFNSVTGGKGNMPSFKDALTPAQIKLLWAYVGSRGGKEP